MESDKIKKRLFWMPMPDFEYHYSVESLIDKKYSMKIRAALGKENRNGE
jgi:hypothetical protein